MKSITKYLVAALLLVAIAIGVVKLNKKPQWITPTELNLTIKRDVLAKIEELPKPNEDSKKDSLHLLAKPSRVVMVKVPKGSHPIALQVKNLRLPLTKVSPTTYRSEPIAIEGKEVEAKLIFPPKRIYKLPLKALRFENEKAYVVVKEKNGTKKVPVTIIKKNATSCFITGQLRGKEVRLP